MRLQCNSFPQCDVFPQTKLTMPLYFDTDPESYGITKTEFETTDSKESKPQKFNCYD